MQGGAASLIRAVIVMCASNVTSHTQFRTVHWRIQGWSQFRSGPTSNSCEVGELGPLYGLFLIIALIWHEVWSLGHYLLAYTVLIGGRCMLWHVPAMWLIYSCAGSCKLYCDVTGGTCISGGGLFIIIFSSCSSRPISHSHACRYPP